MTNEEIIGIIEAVAGVETVAPTAGEDDPLPAAYYSWAGERLEVRVVGANRAATRAADTAITRALHDSGIRLAMRDYVSATELRPQYLIP